MNYDFYKKDKDIKADIKAAKTRGESIGLMEPLLIGDGSRHRPELTDLALDLAAKSAGFRRSLPETLLASLADLVRAMNCHYSNLIEGHDTPRSISNARSRAITVTTPGSAISSAAAVPPRRNDLDGRGNLSAENLAEFTRFFLAVCLDQVTFMEGLMTPDQLRARILLWAEEEIRRTKLPPRSGAVLEALLYRGELPRGDAAAIVGTGERQARRVVSALIDQGAVTSESTRAPLRLAFPAALASRWMPGLFPARMG